MIARILRAVRRALKALWNSLVQVGRLVLGLVTGGGADPDAYTDAVEDAAESAAVEVAQADAGLRDDARRIADWCAWRAGEITGPRPSVAELAPDLRTWTMRLGDDACMILQAAGPDGVRRHLAGELLEGVPPVAAPSSVDQLEAMRREAAMLARCVDQPVPEPEAVRPPAVREYA